VTCPPRPRPDDLEGWTPIRVEWRDGAPWVDWCHTTGIEFNDPFFDQTVERCLRHPYRLLFRRLTPIECLAPLAPAVRPDGFVFHLSRCGSTLVTQMLATRADTLVLSEPGPLDTIIRSPAPATDKQTWLRWMMTALGHAAAAGQRHTVVKLDTWTTIDLDVVLAAFPSVPWVFVYRDPIDILVSQMSHRGYHVIPGGLSEATVGIDAATAVELPPEEYAARVMRRIGDTALASMDDGRGLLVEYGELPRAVVDRIAAHFGLSTTAADVGAMLAVVGRDAKNPAVAFVDDTARKRAAATPAVSEAAERWLRPMYRQLEQRRRGQAG